MANHGVILRTLNRGVSDPLVRLDLSEALSRDGSFVVIAESGSAPTWEELLEHDNIDLVLLSGPLLQPEAVEAVTQAVATGHRVVVYGGQGCDVLRFVSALLAAQLHRLPVDADQRWRPRPGDRRTCSSAECSPRTLGERPLLRRSAGARELFFAGTRGAPCWNAQRAASVLLERESLRSRPGGT